MSDIITTPASAVVETETVLDNSVLQQAPDAITLVRRLWSLTETTKITVNVYSDSWDPQNAEHRRAGVHPLRGTLDVTCSGPQFLPAEFFKYNAAGLAIAWTPRPADCSVRCAFCDLDDGGRYNKLTWSGPHPDAVVSSKNGDHLYYQLDSCTTEKEAKELNRALAIRFGGDPAVERPDHVMRLPGFWHAKDPQNKYAVRLTHVSDKQSPWKAWALLRSLQVDTSPAAWESYQTHYRAKKAGLPTEIGEYGSEAWAQNMPSVSAYLTLCDRVCPRGTKFPQAWEPGHSPRWYYSLETATRAVKIVSAMTAHDKKAGEAAKEAIRPLIDFQKPEWLAENEPLLRAWVAYAESEIQKVDAEHAGLATWKFPAIKPFDPAAIDAAMIAASGPAPGAKSPSSRPGAWNMHTVDWPGLMAVAGLYRGTEGQKHVIECPWADTHSGDDKTAVVFSPSGGRPGGYHCFHSHGHKTKDLMELLVSRLGSDVVEQYCQRYSITEQASLVYGDPTWEVWSVSKDGRRYPTPHRIENTKAMLQHHHIALRTNLMTHSCEIVFPGAGEGQVAERSQNGGYARVLDLARRYNLQVEAVKDHLTIIWQDSGYHPVRSWIESKKWDGVDRFPALLGSLTLATGYPVDLAGVLLRTWMSTAVAAAMVPAEARRGVAAQGMLVLQGRQGCGKSRWLESLVPSGQGWFADGMAIDPDSRDSIQAVTKNWIVELGELDSTFRKSDVSALKRWVTSPTDTYRSAYDRREEEHARRTVCCALVNPSAFLADETGNRRYWTIPVLECKPEHGIDLQQLWAQVAQEGGQLWLSPEIEKKLAEKNDDYTKSDPISDELTRHYESDPTCWTSYADIRQTLSTALGAWSQRESRSLSTALGAWADQLGLRKKKVVGEYLWPVRPRSSQLAPAVDEALLSIL